MLESLLVSPLHRIHYTRAVNTDARRQIEEGKRGSESNVEHITAAKEAVAKAKIAEREIS